MIGEQMEKMMAIEEKVSVIPSVSLLLSSESIIICRFICRHLSVHCHYQNRQLDRSNSQSHFDNDEDDVFFFVVKVTLIMMKMMYFLLWYGFCGIANIQHAASRIWTGTEPEFWLCWMKFWSSDNHYNK